VVHIRRDYKLPSHRDRLRARGLLTINEIAEQLGVGTSTIKAWRAAGLVTGHTANDKNERLYEPPAARDPRLIRHHGWRLRTRESISSIPGGAV
jgi:transposase-like protein